MVVGACVVKIQLGGVQGTVVVAPDIIVVIIVIIVIIVIMVIMVIIVINVIIVTSMSCIAVIMQSNVNLFGLSVQRPARCIWATIKYYSKARRP